MRLLWLDLNCSYAHTSLALPALHAQTASDTPVEWVVVSATIGEPIGSVVQAISEQQPDIIAATAWLFNHEQLLHILSRAKALLPHSVLLLGGPEFLGNNEPFLRNNPFVNGVFRGEGEEIFPRWIEVWNQPEAWGNLTGLCYLDAAEQYYDNGLARVHHFERLRAPEESRFFNWDKPFVQLETTRGCFNTCAFCVSGGEKPVRTLEMAVVRKRLTEIHRQGIRQVRLLDRTFNYDNQRAKELLALFLEFSPHISFHLEIHPALLSPALKEELAQLPPGLLHLEAGIQSLREEVLNRSQRMGRLTQALDGLQFLCSLPQMETHADLIAGLPGYRLSELVEDIHTLAKYGADEIQLESLKLLPGTAMRQQADKLGIQYAPLPPYEVLQTNEITVNELQRARHLSRLLDGFYNTPTWRSVTRQGMLEHPAFLSDLLNYLVGLGVIDQPLSLEKRGLILYAFAQQSYPDFQAAVSIAWIEAGFSLKKRPAERVHTKRALPPDNWQVLYGRYRESLRLCFLPVAGEDGYWFGFDSEEQTLKPVFKAMGAHHSA